MSFLVNHVQILLHLQQSRVVRGVHEKCLNLCELLLALFQRGQRFAATIGRHSRGLNPITVPGVRYWSA